MSLGRDLLEQAFHLASRESKRPKQASLRRAISTAYYALFHLLTHGAAAAAAPKLPEGLREMVARTLDHADMKKTCMGFASGNDAYLKSIVPGSKKPFQTDRIPLSTQRLLKFPLDDDLIFVMNAFEELQEARHQADYNTISVWNRIAALTKVQLARDAFDAWGRVKDTSNATVFKFALLFPKARSR